MSGLTPKPSTLVKPPIVGEAAFNIECKLFSYQDIFSKSDKSTRTATLLVVEAVMFHAREDIINEKKETVDIKKLRPVWRGGGITYGSCFQGWELPRPIAFREVRLQDGVKKILHDEGILD